MVATAASAPRAQTYQPQQINDYDFNNPGNSKNGKVIGHATQLLWKSTTKVGCATALGSCSDGQHKVFVCQYSPPGNYQGRYGDNVQRP